MNQKLRNKLAAILGSLPVEDRTKLGKAIVNDITEICSLENVPRNRRGWKTLQVQFSHISLADCQRIVKQNGMKFHEFLAGALFVAARNLSETGNILKSPPEPGRASSLLPDQRCFQCVRGIN